MHIHLYRHAGWSGRLVPLDVLVNNIKVSAISRNQKETISLPDEGGVLRLEMQGLTSSPDTFITPEQNDVTFECGTSWWVPFDIVGISLIAPFRKRVFYVRPSKSEDKLNHHA